MWKITILVYLVNVIYRHISTIHKPKMHTTMGFWNRKPMESMMHIILQKGLFKSWNSTVVENDMFCQRQLFGLSFQICRVSDFTVQNFHKGPSIIYGLNGFQRPIVHHKIHPSIALHMARKEIVDRYTVQCAFMHNTTYIYMECNK